ncbi:MAG TPA: hypothetical protein VGM57_14070 [Pseudolabrys sp.]
MRTVLLGGLLGLVTVLGVAGAQAAERKMFIIANDADGYGIDRCLATSAKCGTAAANSYCKSHDFAEAASFSKVDRDEITGSIPAGGSGGCKGPTCNDFVAIVCTR